MNNKFLKIRGILDFEIKYQIHIILSKCKENKNQLKMVANLRFVPSNTHNRM